MLPIEVYIKLEDCKPGHVYRISSRNLSFGVFNPADNGFIGIRNKFGHTYLFTEYHWDTGEPFGTVCPIEEVGACPHPLDESSQELFDFLKEIEMRNAH